MNLMSGESKWKKEKRTPRFGASATGRRKLSTTSMEKTIDGVGLRGKSGIHF